MPDIETWKPIPGFLHYEASDLGRVRSRWSQRLLIKDDSKKKAEYLEVRLLRGNKRHSFSVHHLVLRSFVGLCPKNGCANHKNGIKRDNRLINLEWTTRAGDRQHAYRIGLQTTKLKKDDIKLIRYLHQEGIPANVIRLRFDVALSTIYRITKYKSWKPGITL